MLGVDCHRVGVGFIPPDLRLAQSSQLITVHARSGRNNPQAMAAILLRKSLRRRRTPGDVVVLGRCRSRNAVGSNHGRGCNVCPLGLPDRRGPAYPWRSPRLPYGGRTQLRTGGSWTTLDPRAIEKAGGSGAYRNWAGLPSCGRKPDDCTLGFDNPGTHLIQGYLDMTNALANGIHPKLAERLDGNRGGMPEVVMPLGCSNAALRCFGRTVLRTPL